MLDLLSTSSSSINPNEKKTRENYGACIQALHSLPFKL